jgi:excisionase family DNA binding protein
MTATHGVALARLLATPAETAEYLRTATGVAPLPPLATPAEAATYLRTTTGTLRCWRSLRRGPAYVKSGGRILYPRDAVQAWLKPDCDQ